MAIAQALKSAHDAGNVAKKRYLCTPYSLWYIGINTLK